MSWRQDYRSWSKLAGERLSWLKDQQVTSLDFLTLSRGARAYEGAYRQLHAMLPQRAAVGARGAATDFYDTMHRTIRDLGERSIGQDGLEARIHRLDLLHESLIPYTVVISPSAVGAMLLPGVGSLIAFAVVGDESRHAFRERFQESPGLELHGAALLFIGAVLVVNGLLVGGTVLRAARAGVFLRFWSLVVVATVVLNHVVVFGFVYWTLSSEPDSCINSQLGKGGAAYFSLTTFTTTGFGDYTPVTSSCRLLVAGQMATSILLLSFLADLYVAQTTQTFYRAR